MNQRGLLRLLLAVLAGVVGVFPLASAVAADAIAPNGESVGFMYDGARVLDGASFGGAADAFAPPADLRNSRDSHARAVRLRPADELFAPQPTTGWRVGDSIDNLTAAGNTPSWSAVRARYWKNRTASALDGEFTPAQLERMRGGQPPLHPTLDVPMELDHIVPRHAGGGHNIENLRELWPWQHAEVDPYRYYNGPTP